MKMTSFNLCYTNMSIAQSAVLHRKRTKGKKKLFCAAAVKNFKPLSYLIEI